MKVLAINTYGGSLLLGARHAGCEIVGSYEDSGFGSDIQRANFPNVDTVDYWGKWPKRDLSETIVIAHPPCSAFSVQNTSYLARGVDSDAFECTKRVLDYAMDNKAVAIAVESVTGALSGAWNVHQQYADEHQYRLYRVLENGCMFGPQWRERFWAVWIREGAANRELTWRITPRWATVGEIARPHNDGPSFDSLDEKLETLKQRFVDEAGCDESDLAYIFEPHDPPHDRSVARALQERKFPDEDPYEIRYRYVTTFATSGMRFLHPDKLCPVLLGSSWWYMDGRNLSQKAYKALMGFPVDYVFPERYENKTRTFLSKGVIPDIARWVLEHVEYFLGARRAPTTNSTTYELTVEPDQVANFLIKRKTWDDREKERPSLRHYED